MQVPMTPKRILDRAVKLYPKKTAVVDGDIRLSYEQVQDRVYQVVHALDDLNISQGARVAFLDYNTYRYMELYFGLAQAARVLLPLNIRLYPDDYSYILNDSEAEMLIFHADFKPVIEKIKDEVPTVRYFYIADGPADADWIAGTYEDLIKKSSNEQLFYEPADENDMLNLYYTSGTTGRPKGVMLTHRNIYTNALTTIISFQLEDATTWYHIAPLFHLADAFFIWSVTFQGGSHVMQRQFEPRQVLQTIADERVTAAMMVPTMINFLLDVADIDKYDLSCLEWIMVGGAPMSPANAKKMTEVLGCRYVSGYGLTETTPLLTVGNLKDTLKDAPEEKQMDHITRTGLEVAGVDLRVVDADGNQVPWDNQTVGEIIVRGDNVMKGYWKLPEETEKAIRNGYFHTGDLATVDEEGYVFIVDRAKDIIISGGENISSIEVENVLYTHPDILECAVIAMADPKWGEVPKAVVSLKSGSSADEKTLIDFCRKRMPGFKTPKAISFVDELPKTGSGKIRKVDLR
ncbi:MAG: long-chain-fatty-acid--CoA ligase [Desulfobacterales bacterium]|nr:long-chain-fatty-acid--CoA ligase [Desulfobacterales bacterium]